MEDATEKEIKILNKAYQKCPQTRQIHLDRPDNKLFIFCVTTFFTAFV